MLYHSTRNLQHVYEFEEVLMRGYAEDGGLILPNEIPKISRDVLETWRNHSYADVVFEVAKLYIDNTQIPHDQLHELIKTAYQKFSLPEIVKFSTLKDGTVVAELYHGPTMAFKDLAMVVFVQLMNYFLKKRDKHAIAIVATSGDTGGAAISSMAGLSHIDLMVMLPKDGCTELQKLQMITATQSNIHCYSVDGTSDEEDDVMAKILCDLPFAKEHNLTVANSINWARILVQIATYFYIYVRNVQRIGDEITIVVPSGGGGNIIAGSLAYLMSLPIRLVATVNTNDVIHRFLKKGVLSAASDVTKTWASAMDIQIPANLERLIFLFSGDVELSKRSMEELHNNRSVVIPETVMKKIKSVIVESYTADDGIIVETIAKCWNDNNYLLCPHTSTAIAYIYNQHRPQKDAGKLVCIATASPIKFSEAVIAANVQLPNEDLIKRLSQLPTRYKSLARDDDWEDILRSDIRSISESRTNLN